MSVPHGAQPSGDDARSLDPVSGPFRSSIRVPGSKSLTNRAYVLAAIAEGPSILDAPLRSDDTDRLLVALATLGVPSRWEGERLRIEGCGGRLPRGGRVDLGDGGTPTRFVLALATLASAEVIVDGSDRMRERPIDEGVELLRRLGASMRGTVVGGVERLPVTIGPRGPLEGGTLEVDRTASSQFLSALLLMAPTMRGDLTLRYRVPPTSASYLDLTVDAMRRVGLKVEEEHAADGTLLSHRVRPSRVRPFRLEIEADASSIAYPALSAAVVPGAQVTLEGIPRTSVQPDLALLDAFASMGVSVERSERGIVVTGPARLAPFVGDASRFPDASLALAAACVCADGVSRITGLRTLAVKESDRIAALATELTRLGCRCVATAESLEIDPRQRHTDPVRIETYRDHRIAMSFAAISVARPGISIADPGCVAKSYPGFWTDFARWTGRAAQ